VIDFHSFYVKYAGEVRRFALLLCGNSALADDLTSETFVRVWNSGGKIQQVTVKAYLFTITRNLFRDHLRRQKRWADLDEGVPDTSVCLELRAEHSEELRKTLESIQRLPEQERAALLMYAVDAMSYREIADVLGLSLAATKLRIYRARLKLIQASHRTVRLNGVKV